MNCNLESCTLTLNTTRICANDAIDTSIEVSKIGFTNMKPNAVILVNEEEIFDGITASSLVYHPINAPILFTYGERLRKDTLDEIQRLDPKGYNGIHVILVGRISKKVSAELNDYGFKTHHISGGNHYETACIIPGIRKEYKNILIMSGEEYSEGIVTGYWSAHYGDPILFVKKDKIPQCTLEAIKKMSDINIYIVGSTKTVSRCVEDYLSNLDNVKNLGRINGKNPYEIAVNFAKYKDPKTEFGWGRSYRDGNAFTFGVINKPMDIIAGALFAHMGKHTPSLLIGKDRIPEVVEQYVKSVKPMPPKDMPRPPFMHGYILGTTQNISYKEQIMIEAMLSIEHEMTNMDDNMMEMHHKMMNMKHEMIDMHNEKMGMDCDMNNMKSMNHSMMNMEHDMTDMHDEMMGMEYDMSKMMMMHNQMMDIDDEDAMKHEHCMYHINKDNDEENEINEMEENMEYKHEISMYDEDNKNYEKNPYNYRNKISKEHRIEFNNINYRISSIDEILE